jgi:Transposase DDE domain
MSPVHANKKGIRYRYYVSRQLQDGFADANLLPTGKESLKRAPLCDPRDAHDPDDRETEETEPRRSGRDVPELGAARLRRGAMSIVAAAGACFSRQHCRITQPHDITFRSLVDMTKLRWRIERDYQELKQEVGLGHFEGRGWRGFHHHATLCIAAYGFLISERETIPPCGPCSTTLFPQPAVPNGYRPRGSALAA